MIVKTTQSSQLTAKTLRACDYLGVDRRTDLAKARYRKECREKALQWAAAQSCITTTCNPPDEPCGPCCARAGKYKCRVR